MTKTFSLISTILWIKLILISYCECPEGSNPGAESSITENRVENDPLQRKYEFKSENLVRKPIRTFEPGSRGYGAQSDLGYLGKPEFPSQWIMTEEIFRVEGRIYSPTMGIASMHYKKYKGDNVGVVIIANSEVHCKHEQISSRCRLAETEGYSAYPKKPTFNFRFRAEKYSKISPKALATAVAGIIGMTDDGLKCGVGVAPHCIIGNIVIELSNSNGSPENCAYKIGSKENSPVALFVHAWQKPQHDYRSNILRLHGNYEYMHFVKGRPHLQYKPHIMGSGDLGLIANCCQTNEYMSTDSSFVFGSVAYNGFLTPYSETCASLMGVTYSTSNGYKFYNDILTIPSSDDALPALAPKGTTTVSAAIAGGIVALIIDCYKKLYPGKTPSIYDLAFLLAFSADSEPLQNKNMLWFTNAAGLKYSPQAGFGLPSLEKAIELIKAWVPVGEPHIYECSPSDKKIQFKCGPENIGRRSLTYTSNMSCRFSIHDAPSNFFIQTVTVKISAKLLKRGSMSAFLISPGGTVSCLLEGRPYDSSREHYTGLRLRSNHFMGEVLTGTWQIKIFTYKEDSKPTFLPLYAFKTGSDSPSSLPISPYPLTSSADPHNPVPKDYDQSGSLNKDILNAATTEGLRLPPNSDVKDLDANPHTASSTGVNSGSGQHSQSTSAQGQAPLAPITSDTQPPLAGVSPVQNPNPSDQTNNPPPVPATTLNTEASQQNSKSPSTNNGGTSGGTSAPSSNGDPKNGATPNGVPAPSNSPRKQSSSYPRRSRVKPANEVGEMRFRFLLVENLPRKLEIEQKPKSKERTAFEFRLTKMWADFRQYLLVQTDPQNYGTSTVELWEVYGITNIFIQKLLMYQKNVKLKSSTSIPEDYLHKLTGGDDTEHSPHLQRSDSLTREGIYPDITPSQKIQNSGALPATPGDHRQQPPSS